MLLTDWECGEECPCSELEGDVVVEELFDFGAPTGFDAIPGRLPSAMSLKERGYA